MTPVTGDNTPTWNYIVEAILGLVAAYLAWTQKTIWNTLASKQFVMEQLEKHTEADEARDLALIEAAAKPLKEAQAHLHDDLREIKNDIKSILRSLGRLEGGD